MFLFKKLAGPLLFPLPIALVLLTAGVLLLWFGRRQRAGKVVVTAGLVWLALFSFRPVPHALLGGLERTYATFDPATPGYREALAALQVLGLSRLGPGH